MCTYTVESYKNCCTSFQFSVSSVQKKCEYDLPHLTPRQLGLGGKVIHVYSTVNCKYEGLLLATNNTNPYPVLYF